MVTTSGGNRHLKSELNKESKVIFENLLIHLKRSPKDMKRWTPADHISWHTNLLYVKELKKRGRNIIKPNEFEDLLKYYGYVKTTKKQLLKDYKDISLK